LEDADLSRASAKKKGKCRKGSEDAEKEVKIQIQIQLFFLSDSRLLDNGDEVAA
jgi:hypothetical protein